MAGKPRALLARTWSLLWMAIPRRHSALEGCGHNPRQYTALVCGMIAILRFTETLGKTPKSALPDVIH